MVFSVSTIRAYTIMFVFIHKYVKVTKFRVYVCRQNKDNQTLRAQTFIQMNHVYSYDIIQTTWYSNKYVFGFDDI